MSPSSISLISNDRGSMVAKGAIAGLLTILVFSAIASIFIFTTGEDVASGHPNVQAQVDYDTDGEFIVTHNGGNTVTGQNTRQIKIVGDVNSFAQTTKRINVGEEYTSGDIIFQQNNVTLEPGDSVQILLIANEGGSEVPIGRYEV